ncbi:MAG: hypothetical protein ACJZ9F_04600 [Rhodospirillaceae bacterium]
MSNNIVIATSISPIDERGVQPAAIASWLDHGCTVVSVNNRDEMMALAPAFPNVTFVEAERTAERFTGRPVPYIFDMIQAARNIAQPGQVIGLTNADIFLRSIEGLTAFLCAEAQGCLILGPRVDVSGTESLSNYKPSEKPDYSQGYDFFLMDQEIVEHFGDSPFAIGMPFWDYWLPLTAHLAGCTLKTLHMPVALHVAHETQWNDTIYLFFHALIAYTLEQSRNGVEGNTAEQRQLLFMLDVFSHIYGHIFESGTANQEGVAPDPASTAALAELYDLFQEAAIHTVKSNANSIRLNDA